MNTLQLQCIVYVTHVYIHVHKILLNLAVNYVKEYNYIVHIEHIFLSLFLYISEVCNKRSSRVSLSILLDPISPISTEIYVQLEALSFTVEEEMDFVEICVNVSSDEDNKCPIEFNAGVTLSTRDGTAGTVIIIVCKKMVQK